jgi:hypothetical protein
MPISRKRFSKKRIPKKSVSKNTRKHKKRTSRRKYKKSGKRLRFFGGVGEDEECAICYQPMTPETTYETKNCKHKFHRACIERWCDGKTMCDCPTCRTELNPNPNPKLKKIDFEHLYRVQFFTFVNNPRTGEIYRVPVRIQDISGEEIDILADYFIDKIHGLTPDDILFYGGADLPDPYGYISLEETYNTVVINEGDMDVINPAMPIKIHSVTITRVPNFDA